MPTQISINSTIRLRSGYDLPLLGFGVYLNNDPKPAVLAALNAGYRHIDTARMYGNEAQVGEAVRQSDVPREQIYITTKVNNGEHGYDATVAAVNDSLKTLGVDYIDSMLIHTAMSNKDLRLESWRALIDAKKQGKVRSIGVSNYGVKHLEEIRETNLELPDVNQIELQPLNQQKEIVDYCKENGVVIEAYAPLMRTQWDVPAILETAKKYNKEPAQVLIRWSLQRGFAPIPKSANPARVATNATVYDFELSPEDVAVLDALDRGKDGTITWNPVDVD